MHRKTSGPTFIDRLSSGFPNPNSADKPDDGADG